MIWFKTMIKRAWKCTVKLCLAGSQKYKEGREVVTSSGPGNAFEFALKIVEKLEGAEKMERVAAPLSPVKK